MTTRPARQLLFSFLFLLTFLLPGRAQQSDVQLWSKADLGWDAGKKWKLRTELEQRFTYASFRLSRTMLTQNAERTLGEYFSLGGGARAGLVTSIEGRPAFRYRLHLDGRAAYEWDQVSLAYRARVQYGFDGLPGLAELRLNTLVQRNRIQAGDHIFGTRFHWDLYAESFHGSLQDRGWQTYAMRYAAGLRYDLGFSSRLSMRYILEKEINLPNPLSLHVIYVGYGYRF